MTNSERSSIPSLPEPIVRAVELLYTIDEGEIAIPIFADMGENGDTDALIGLGELAARHGDAAGADKLMLCRVGPPLLIEIDGEERRAGVEDSSERAHQSGEQTGDDDAAESWRQKILNQHGKRSLGDVRNGVAVGSNHLGEFGNLAAPG